jgi:hypothetical protein
MRLYLNLNAIIRHPLNRDKRRAFRRNRVAIKNCGKEGQPRGGKSTVDAAFDAMSVEEPHLAATLFDEAIGPDPEAAIPHALHQYGVALAWVGRLDDSERALRLAFDKEPSALIAYRFGSVLAERRKFSEAMAAFAAIDRSQPWMAGGSVRSIRFPARKDDLDAFEVPFRRTVSGLFDGSAGDREFVYFVAADSRYTKRFARALHSSLAAAQANCLLHIHVINPDAATSALLSYMKERPGPIIAWSFEEVDLSGLSNDQRRVYYASARFFVLSALRRHYGKSVIAADIDQIVLRNPALLIEPASDVSAIRFPFGRFNLMARFSASAIIASSSAAATYFDRVAAYLTERMRDPSAIAWHLDQVALDIAYLVSDDIVLSDLPQAAMLSAAPDADVPTDTFFWSVTYSVAANAGKLAHPIFRQLETAPLVVVTRVFDHSEGLKRTIESVARDGYSNVAHIVIDHRGADGPKDSGTASFTIDEPTQNEGGFRELLRAMPDPIFIELPCGDELEPRMLLKLMLAIETVGSRLLARRSDGREVIELPAGIGLGSKGERLTVFRKQDWTEHRSRVKVVVRPWRRRNIQDRCALSELLRCI